MALLFLLLALFFGGWGLTAEPPRMPSTPAAPSEDPSAPPELWPKRSTHNAPDG